MLRFTARGINGPLTSIDFGGGHTALAVVVDNKIRARQQSIPSASAQAQKQVEQSVTVVSVPVLTPGSRSGSDLAAEARIQKID
jgi:hypothetical protein